jgi:hypothetical protein
MRRRIRVRGDLVAEAGDVDRGAQPCEFSTAFDRVRGACAGESRGDASGVACAWRRGSASVRGTVGGMARANVRARW